MKKQCLCLCVLAMLAAGCQITVRPAIPPPPPPPVVAVPEYYAWDGVEFVGVVGGQYMYLGPGNVWLVCDPLRLGRFHEFERVNPRWHEDPVNRHPARPAERRPAGRPNER
jgi:hypothetical protein